MERLNKARLTASKPPVPFAFASLCRTTYFIAKILSLFWLFNRLPSKIWRVAKLGFPHIESCGWKEYALN